MLYQHERMVLIFGPVGWYKTGVEEDGESAMIVNINEISQSKFSAFSPHDPL